LKIRPKVRPSHVQELCQTKIENLRVIVTRDNDVVGLQIPMHDARGVSFGKAFGNLP
jgi:hypothetical protein